MVIIPDFPAWVFVVFENECWRIKVDGLLKNRIVFTVTDTHVVCNSGTCYIMDKALNLMLNGRVLANPETDYHNYTIINRSELLN